MAYSNEIVRKARAELASRKADHESRMNYRLQQAYSKVPRIREIDGLLRNILKEQVFLRENVRRIRIVQWCCGIVGLICIPAACCYYPLIFLVVIMGFLSLVVSVVTSVMEAAVAIREENDLTI